MVFINGIAVSQIRAEKNKFVIQRKELKLLKSLLNLIKTII